MRNIESARVSIPSTLKHDDSKKWSVYVLWFTNLLSSDYFYVYNIDFTDYFKFGYMFFISFIS